MRFEETGTYVATDDLRVAVNAAIVLERPLLVKGEPGKRPAIEGSLDVIAEACAAVGVRSLVAYGITDRHGPDGARRGLAENERFIKAGGRGLVGIHAAFTCSDELLHAAAGLARDLGVGVHIHVCEGVGDVDAPRRLAGLTRDDWLLATASTCPPTTSWPARSSTTRAPT